MAETVAESLRADRLGGRSEGNSVGDLDCFLSLITTLLIIEHTIY